MTDEQLRIPEPDDDEPDLGPESDGEPEPELPDGWLSEFGY